MGQATQPGPVAVEDESLARPQEIQWSGAERKKRNESLWNTRADRAQTSSFWSCFKKSLTERQ